MPKSTKIDINIPHEYLPRPYQRAFWEALDANNGESCKRAVKVWHRRAGKDKTDLNFLIKRMFPEAPGGRIGTYYHLFPTYAQGKKIIWDGMDASGFKFMDHFPAPLVAQKNETEMQVTLVNGSIYQIVGVDKIDLIIGTNPVGCVFSEYALQNPAGWDLLRPILTENKGWAVFNFTPRGHNHGKQLYDMASNNPEWFCELLTVRDTFREDGTPVVSEAQIQAEREAGMDEELIQQEFFCSFQGYQVGSYYAKQIRQAEEDKRITNLSWRPDIPVFTFWDLGVGDSMAIWFAQKVWREVHFIDYYETSGEGMPFFAKVLRERPYVYSRHYMPHDASHREVGTGLSRRDTAEKLGIQPIDVVKRGDVEDGIDAVRSLFPRCWFDKTKCRQGLDALSSYQKEWDEDRREYKAKPVHNWASHGSDAFRTAAMSDFETAGDFTPSEPIKVITRPPERHHPYLPSLR